MIWLILEIWGFLLAAFFVGALAGWWISSQTRRALVTSNAPSLDAAPPGQRAAMSPPRLDPAAAQHGGDDLTQIIGIASADALRLNGLGIYRLIDVAGWTTDNVRWVENQFGAPERIVRERWVEQARNLVVNDAN